MTDEPTAEDQSFPMSKGHREARREFEKISSAGTHEEIKKAAKILGQYERDEWNGGDAELHF